ncbi:hypothetical protein CBR_g23375 [Chara braunii]|uniref:Myb-like domain-containing protein n=1 Tax=Chara braunii TaxID=69332 RepID=A0A388L408_CHABU|nr:hypothetical protein CBR_g23375 [Chara braunii]|eukprot:GBG77049.1 hypothetical protein CBR_g23375 [Chara braunii]
MKAQRPCPRACEEKVQHGVMCKVACRRRIHGRHAEEIASAASRCRRLPVCRLPPRVLVVPAVEATLQAQGVNERRCAGGSASNGCGEYTTLLQQGLGADDNGGVDLRFGLSSGGGREASRTFIIDADPSPRGVQQSGSRHIEQSTLRSGASVCVGVRPSSAGRQHGSSAPSVDQLTSTCLERNGVAVGSLRIGGTLHSMPRSTTPTQPDLRDDGTCRAAVRPTPSVENITRGVSNMRVHNDGGDDDGGGGDDADGRFGEDVEAGDDDDDIPIRPLGKTGGRGRGCSRAVVRGRSVGHGGRGGVSDDGGKSVTYWSPEEQIQLVRCKREQEMHLAGLGHNYGQMRTKEWKWEDIAKRMANAGRPKDGRGRRQALKAKRVRTEDALPRVRGHGAQGWAEEAEGDCDDEFTAEEEQAEATTSEVRESDRQRSSDRTASKRMQTPPHEAQQLRGRETRTEKAPVVDLGGDDDEPLERCRIRIRTTATPLPEVVVRVATNESPISGRLPATPSQPRQRNDAGDGGSVQRGGGGEVVADERSWRPGGRCRGGSWFRQCGRRSDWEGGCNSCGDGERGGAWREESRAGGRRRRFKPATKDKRSSVRAAVENVALRILHGWVFKSGNRPRGYHVAFQYSLESFATDIASVMWYGEEWCEVVSPAICSHTIDLSMDLPLWFAGANIEDRPEDDDMAVHQESTIIRVAYAFRAAVQMGLLIDGEFISHDRLSRVADCFRLFLAACMWIMRMAGDDPRSHYEAFDFADLVVKHALVEAMHRSFDHRRSVVRAAKVVTERLGKATATFRQYPNYIPQWAPCGIAFRHDTSITGLEDARKLDWLGSGPPDDDNNNDRKDDA